MYLHTRKQLKYFDEVIRLHVEEGLGEDSIATRVPIGHTTIGRWISAYKSGDVLVPPSLARVDTSKDIVEMYESGMSMRAIGRATGLSKSTICRKIANFVPEKENIVMQEPVEQPKDLLEAQKKIKELEDRLQRAELARDAYNEMINVAEVKFNIPIRKKAGAKR